MSYRITFTMSIYFCFQLIHEFSHQVIENREPTTLHRVIHINIYSYSNKKVTMSTDEAAELAIRDKSPRLDGRRCNVNLAYIGQKKKSVALTGKCLHQQMINSRSLNLVRI